MTFALVGVLAGVITTVAGMGGGLVMVVVFSAMAGPHFALGVTAPALLLANLHRLWLLWPHLDRQTAVRVSMGTVPGALVGGLLALSLPDGVLRGIILTMALGAVLRALGWLRVPAGSAIPAGVLTGLVSATSGGGGLVLGPWFLARGLSGATLVATAAASAIVVHATRMLVYGAGQLAGPRELGLGVALAAAVALGNLLGVRLRRHLNGPRQAQVQLAVMVGCVLFSLFA